MSEATTQNGQNPFLQTHPHLTGHIFEHRGCPIHYWTGGKTDGEWLVFMHGALMDHRMFNAQVEEFMPGYRLLVWDARGQGQSQPIGLASPTMEDYAADMAALLDHLGAQKVTLIGQSMGAYAAQHLARLYPERVHAVVIIGSTPIAFPVSALEMAGLRFSITAFRLWPYQSLARMMARNTTIRPEVVDYAQDAIQQVDHKTLLAIWGAVNTAVRQQGYPDFVLGAPLLLTHGDKDHTGTIRRDAPRWAAAIPEIRYQVIPDAGHNANQDNPEFFNRVLAEFLSRVQAG